jgi:C-terminal processing protease CtpA/Prc
MASPASPQVERLAGLAKLWGAIKFFHPYIAEKDIDWDSALIQTIPKVESASGPEEYRRAIEYLLSFLHDPGTYTITRPPTPRSSIPAASGGPAQPYVHWTDDRMAIVVANDFSQFVGNLSKLDRLKKSMGEATNGKGIIFDLRGHRSEVDGSSAYWFMTQFIEAIPTILDREIVESGTRSRVYSGYPGEGGYDGYFSASVVQDGHVLKGTAAKGTARPMAFLIDSGTPDLSPLLGGLQSAGQAIIVLQGPLAEDAGLDVYTMEIPDNVKVAFRVDELVNPDGSLGLHPDITLPLPPASEAGDRTLDAALAALRRGFRGTPRAKLQPHVIPSRLENPYPQMEFPNKEYRLLALFRYWNVMRYFHAYHDLLDQPWEQTLTDFIPLFEADQGAQEYAITVAKMAVRIQDTHGFVRSKVLSEYIGTAWPPLIVRSIEGQSVVTRVLDDPAAKSSGIAVGDVILEVDGEAIVTRRQRLSEVFPASTPQALRTIVDTMVLAGPPDKPAGLRVKGAGGDMRSIDIARHLNRPKDVSGRPAFRLLAEGFGYIDLTQLMPAQIDAAFDVVRSTRATIFDMRGYPNGVFGLLGAHLTDKKVVAARFETPSPQSPDPDEVSRVRFLQYAQPGLPGQSWKYKGKVVVLIDERTISQAENTCLFLEAMTHATFVGAPTNGANGDVTSVVLPGDIHAFFSGHDVRHGDGRQLQRVGVQPDVPAEPTIEGIRGGRDEVLEAAVKYLQSQE